jgi:hypothetical protein
MLQFVFVPSDSIARSPLRSRADQRSAEPLEARVKRECAELYPGVDPRMWYQVVLDGEYQGDLEGFWIQVDEWVTYVLTKHFDVQTRPALH